MASSIKMAWGAVVALALLAAAASADRLRGPSDLGRLLSRATALASEVEVAGNAVSFTTADGEPICEHCDQRKPAPAAGAILDTTHDADFKCPFGAGKCVKCPCSGVHHCCGSHHAPSP